MHQRALRDLDAVRDQIEALKRREAGLVKTIEGIVDAYPNEIESAELAVDATDAPPSREQGVVRSRNGRVPKGQEAVELILIDTHPRWLTIPDLTNEMQTRGWMPRSRDPENAVRTATTRLHQKKRIQRKKRGRAFVYRVTTTSQESEAPGEPRASEHVLNQGGHMDSP
jgi:hypothetical protein